MVKLTNNIEWVKSNTPRIRNTKAANQETGIKMICGIQTISARKGTTFNQFVKFGNYFNPDCKPVVIVSLRAVNEAMVWVRTAALDGTNNITGEGFAVRGHSYSSNSKRPNYISQCYIDWVAIGY